jgi:hydrogenase maturation factor
MFWRRSVKARSGQLAHITDNIRKTVMNVPVLITGGDTTNCKHPKQVCTT